jgi:hypothetical protein
MYMKLIRGALNAFDRRDLFCNQLKSIQGTALLVGRSRDRSPLVSLGIFFEATDGTMCAGIDSLTHSQALQPM